MQHKLLETWIKLSTQSVVLYLLLMPNLTVAAASLYKLRIVLSNLTKCAFKCSTVSFLKSHPPNCILKCFYDADICKIKGFYLNLDVQLQTVYKVMAYEFLQRVVLFIYRYPCGILVFFMGFLRKVSLLKTVLTKAYRKCHVHTMLL